MSKIKDKIFYYRKSRPSLGFNFHSRIKNLKMTNSKHILPYSIRILVMRVSRHLNFSWKICFELVIFKKIPSSPPFNQKTPSSPPPPPKLSPLSPPFNKKNSFIPSSAPKPFDSFQSKNAFIPSSALLRPLNFSPVSLISSNIRHLSPTRPREFSLFHVLLHHFQKQVGLQLSAGRNQLELGLFSG